MTTLALSILHPDPRNANVCGPDILAKLSRNMNRTKLCPALIVRPHPSIEGEFQIIDGHHRAEVAKQLGWNEIPCQIWTVSDHEAQIALATLNRLRGTDIPHKRAELLAGLVDLVPIADLAEFLPEDEKQIEDLLSLISFDEEATIKSIQKEMEKEKAELPVAFGFLIAASEAGFVEESLNLANAKDRAQALILLCKKYREHLHVEN